MPTILTKASNEVFSGCRWGKPPRAAKVTFFYKASHEIEQIGAIYPRSAGELVSMTQPLAIDLFCGLGGWAEGFLSEDYRVIGFDIERHDYGTGGYPAQLVLQDVTTLHGSQFRDAAVIVASPPCQAYSYRAMPWSRAKALPPPDNTLFEAPFRIQQEASEAAGRYIPLVVENVRGAQKWVGRAKANFGSFYMWGDVAMIGRRVVVGPLQYGAYVQPMRDRKTHVGSWDLTRKNYQKDHTWNPDAGVKWGECSGKRFDERPKGNVAAHREGTHIKQGGDWFGKNCESSMSRMYGSKSVKRKAASAQIAKIPFPLASHIAKCFRNSGIVACHERTGS